MDFSAAAQWLEEEGDEMTKKLRIPDGARPDRDEQRRRGMLGLIRRLNDHAKPPTMPMIKAPTLAEIEAKYGK